MIIEALFLLLLMFVKRCPVAGPAKAMSEIEFVCILIIR